MAELILLRHGQASFGTDNYDKLSELGHQQSRWLGQHLRQLDQKIDRIVTGNMLRHHQTAESFIEGLKLNITPESHPGLNEYNFKGLLEPLKQYFSEHWVETGHARRDYYYNMKCALNYWMQGLIESDGYDTWPKFCERVQDAFRFCYDHPAKNILVITSGGPISVILGDVLQLDKERICNITLQIKNTSISKVLYNQTDFNVDSFNDISHLLSAERQQHITFS